MKKAKNFTEEELKAFFSAFLEQDSDPAPESVSEAYIALRNAHEDYLCALEECQFRAVFMYGYELGRKSVGEKEGGIRVTHPINEQAFVSSWLAVLGEPDEGDAALAQAIASAINRSYNAGKEDGIRIGVRLKGAVAMSQQDETVNELMVLRDQFRDNKSSTRQWVDQLLERLDERQLRIVCFFIKGMTGDVI